MFCTNVKQCMNQVPFSKFQTRNKLTSLEGRWGKSEFIGRKLWGGGEYFVVSIGGAINESFPFQLLHLHPIHCPQSSKQCTFPSFIYLNQISHMYNIQFGEVVNSFPFEAEDILLGDSHHPLGEAGMSFSSLLSLLLESSILQIFSCFTRESSQSVG